jgi:hypothetical protein
LDILFCNQESVNVSPLLACGRGEGSGAILIPGWLLKKWHISAVEEGMLVFVKDITTLKLLSDGSWKEYISTSPIPGNCLPGSSYNFMQKPPIG